VAVVLERNGVASWRATDVSESFHLTEREREVAELLIQGFTNKEIAGRMNISPNTVRAFIRMVMGKLSLDTFQDSRDRVSRHLYCKLFRP
jgi:DNA-binding NarL/FixJ family response regulator